MMIENAERYALIFEGANMMTEFYESKEIAYKRYDQLKDHWPVHIYKRIEVID